jgi:hypothetical protein
MPYKVINPFNDLQHEVLYQKGDTYPKEGYEVDEKRVAELQGIHPKYKRAFLATEKSDDDQDTGTQEPVGDPDEVTVDIDALTKEQLKEEVTVPKLKEYLDSKEIEYKSSDNKDALIELILKKKK